MRRPMCILAVIVLVFSFFRISEKNPEVKWEQNSMMYMEGYVKNKQLLETVYGQVWQVILQDVRGGMEPDAWDTCKGLYLCQFPYDIQWEPEIGQRIRVQGKFSQWEPAANPGQFDQRKWYRSQGIYGQLKQCSILGATTDHSFLQEQMWKGRMWLHEQLLMRLGSEDGALISAMVLGEKSSLDPEIKQLYQKNGISHILSISGLHLTLLGMGLIKLLRHSFLGNKSVAVCSGLIMLCYCVFSGSSISTKRATLMFLISLIAGLVGRAYDSLSALGLAAIIQILENPYVIENTGFQLSFLAVLGVTVINPGLEKLFQAAQKWEKAFLVSLSASLSTLPILLYNYGTYPWHGILLNMLIVPAMSLLLSLSIVLIVLSILSYPFAFLQNIVLLPVGGIKGILWYYENCCRVFQEFPFQDGYLGAPSFIQVCLYYILLAFIVSRIEAQRGFGKKIFLLIAIQILTSGISSGMEITMLDVGQGDGIVIKNSNDNVYLSDCGSSSVSKVGMYRLVPFLKYKGYGKIEGIFISHLDQDHINGIEELLDMADEERIEINYLFLPVSVRNIEEMAEKWKVLCQKARLAGAKIVYLQEGDRISDGEMEFHCLHPTGSLQSDSSNDSSMVLALKYDEFDMLLTGDVEKAGEKAILEENDRIGHFEILKVAHHGSAGSSSMKFLEKIKPEISLISCGENNSYGHPHEETLERLESVGSRVMTTPEYGAITIKVGKEVRIYGFKNIL